MTQEKLLSPAEAARRLKISVRRVQRLCKDGRIGTKVGASYVISDRDLEKFAKIPRLPGRPNPGGTSRTRKK